MRERRGQIAPVASNGSRERECVARSLGRAIADVRPRHHCSVSDQRNAAKGELRRQKIVDWREEGTLNPVEHVAQRW